LAREHGLGQPGGLAELNVLAKAILGKPEEKADIPQVLLPTLCH
jgi:hypothetical protein